MSTTFVINNDEAQFYDTEYEIEVAYRGNTGKIYFTDNLAPLLSDDYPVLAIDNDPQGIYTIGDIRKEIIKNKIR